MVIIKKEQLLLTFIYLHYELFIIYLINYFL